MKELLISYQRFSSCRNLYYGKSTFGAHLFCAPNLESFVDGGAGVVRLKAEVISFDEGVEVEKAGLVFLEEDVG